jgi:hypothetical protein
MVDWMRGINESAVTQVVKRLEAKIRSTRKHAKLARFSKKKCQMSRCDPNCRPEISSIGFRVASVPEPSTYALILMTGAGGLWWARRRR